MSGETEARAAALHEGAREHADAGDLETTGVTLANALRPLALLREERGRGDEAVQLWTEARALYAAAGVQAGVDEADGHLLL